MCRAVRDLRATVGDSDDVRGVDSRGGHRDVAGGDGGGLGRAVRDRGGAAGDGDELGGEVGGDWLGGHGTSGQESSSDVVTHLEGVGCS